ncbi:M23 family metallopeptidase [Streptomyces sp. NPDC001743]|uniref:M23 family metallopeptidase n=1 Tax=Streptomyces sp. NPDC001743 TaxID=3154397 RepID=UPI003316B43F
MNDQHPHAGYAGYDGHSTGGFDSDPLFGSLPGTYDDRHDGSYETTTGYAAPYGGDQTGHSGTYDSSPWDTGAHHTAAYGHSAEYTAYTAQPQQEHHHPYDGDSPYDTGATWVPADGDYGPTVPAQHPAPDSSGQWDTTAWQQNGQWTDAGTTGYDTGAYDATAWNTGATPEHEQRTGPAETSPYEVDQTAQHSYAATEDYEAQPAFDSYDSYEPEPYRTAEFSVPETDLAPEAADGPAEDEDSAAAAAGHRPAGRTAARSGGSRSRRRSPAKRSALLTVAVPSACVMSVAGIAAASVGGMGGGEEKKDETTAMAAADPGTVKPVAANNKLDTQLANLSADAENFADRASRTQERLDLKERQAAEKKRRLAEAARKEALRPKFVMPVMNHRLSAYFGQAGVNWMSVHTGIDFPVDYGTPVMSATDGTVRTQINSAYGNMAIVTAADGTETWYCHLSSTRIRSGPVKAGDVIAYSGDSGNSTGPHLHFEVRPGGGAAIDPLPWLRSHNVNPN